MAYKLSVYIVLFLVFFNGGAALLDASGTTEHLGLDTTTSNGDDIEAKADNARDFSVGGGVGETLFGLYNAVAGVLETVFDTLTPGAKMLKSAGVPDYLVNFTFAGLYVVPGIDLINFFRSG